MYIAVVIRICIVDLFRSFTSYQTNATPLYVASQVGHHGVVQSLLGAGAEVNIARSDVSNVTCVHRVHVRVYCGGDGGEAQHGVCVMTVCASCACV